MKIKLILFFSLVLLFSLNAQNEAQLDSLKQIAFNTKKSDSIRTYAYVPIISYYHTNKKDSCKYYFDELFQFAKKSNYPIAFNKYHSLKASYFGLFLTPEEDAYTFIQTNLLEAKKYAELGGRLDLVSLVYTRLIPENFRFGYEELALQYCYECEKVAIKSKMWEDLAYCYAQVGKIYNLGYKNTEKALRYLLKSDSVYNNLERKSSRQGFTLSFIGDVYESLGNYEEAENHQLEAFEVFKDFGDQYQQAFIKGKLASLEKRKGNYTKALQLVSEGLAYYRKRNSPLQIAGFLVIQSNIYATIGQWDKALQAGEEAITLNKQLKSKLGTIRALINQSQILSKKQLFNESNALAREAETMAYAQNSYEELKQIYEVLIANAESETLYKDAFENTKQLQVVIDTLSKRENLILAKDLEAKYQTNQKEKEIDLLKSKNDLIKAQQKNQQYLFWGVFIFSLLVIATLFLLYRNRQKTNKRLEELDLAKTTFFQNISHEFRTPLSLIYGPVDRIISENKLPESEKEDLHLVKRNAQRLNELVNQILDVSKLEANQWQLRVSEIEVTPLLKAIASSFQFQAQQKQLQFNFNISQTNLIWLDKDVIEKVTTNLLSNAIKYTPSGGKVNLQTWVDQENIYIKVENNGRHFTEKELSNVFNRFIQLNTTNNNVGSGIGLALVKQLVEICKGSIKVSNTKEDCICFEIQLPIKKSAYQTHQIIALPETEEFLENEANRIDENSEFPILLIVDDHQDIRAFIKSSFQNTYQVIEASDGALGLQVAFSIIPDIIISDVMMPKVSGTELCKQLKEDERTSHIPIILLSAKDDIESNFQGIEVGADDYMPKPFSYKLLKSKLQNLIASRQKLRDRYSKEIILKPTDIAINSAEERFIEKMKEVLDINLTDDSFSAEKFSEEMTMSRMQLHRKLKALTGLSTTEFLRTERLKAAIVLLKDVSLNINEIGYQVGFSSPSYFTKCFKEMFGMLPSEYQKNL